MKIQDNTVELMNLLHLVIRVHRDSKLSMLLLEAMIIYEYHLNAVNK